MNKLKYSQNYGFSSSHLWMWDLDHKEGWALKNWCFQTVALGRRLLRVPWTARRSNQSILKEINPEYSLEELILKLKLQYSGHLMLRADLLEKTLMVGKIEGRRRWWQGEMVGWHHWLNGHESEQTPGNSKGQGSLVCCSAWSQSRTQLSDWTTTNRI